MNQKQYPVIDLAATGQNILRLRQEKGLSVRDLQAFFGFEEPQAIYKWQRGRCLPTVDNLCALSVLLEEPMNNILVLKGTGQKEEPWAEAHGSFAVRLSGPGAAGRDLFHFVLPWAFSPPQRGPGRWKQDICIGYGRPVSLGRRQGGWAQNGKRKAGKSVG